MIAEVIVDVQASVLDKIFDYIVPSGVNISEGHRVLLPFGNRTIEGYVIKLKEQSSLPYNKLKEIIKPLDVNPLILKEHLELIDKVKNEYNLRMVDVLKLILPSQVRNGNVKSKTVLTVCVNDEDAILKLKKNAKNQIKAFEDVKNHKVADLIELKKLYSNSSVNSLIKIGALKIIENKTNRTPKEYLTFKNEKIILNKEQQNAVSEILNKPMVHLLFGVTGSGKTEVYLNVISNVINQNKTAIMLVPEIALTPKTVGQFRARFGDCVAVLHSGLSAGEKFDEWMRVYNKEAKIVVGARSAIFAPVKNVGAIIIDEEHDGSYKSESNPRFDTHFVAIERGKYNNCPVVLGSATPTVESFYNAEQKKYNLITLKNRVNGEPLPPISIVNMTNEFKNGNTSLFSNELLSAISNTVSAGEQAILFLNRRGYSSFLMCKECGYVATCSDCDVSLVYHKEDNMLKCHYCGKRFKVLTKCPVCGNANLKLGNTGTEKVVAELTNLFPHTKIFRMDNDTTTTKSAHSKILSEFEKTKPAILVGTQMIAKGHDFPFVTLVGILDADLSLFFCDFMATEKTYQLITQVSGRAGRANKAGKVILQTFFPKHYVYNFCVNYDYLRFYQKEINLRETTSFPPFSKIIRILITSENEQIAKNMTHELFLKLKEDKIKYKEDFYFLEAMRSPLTKIKNKFRFQILMRIKNNNNDLINEIFNAVGNGNDKCQIFTEINPQNLS